MQKGDVALDRIEVQAHKVIITPSYATSLSLFYIILTFHISIVYVPLDCTLHYEHVEQWFSDPSDNPS